MDCGDQIGLVMAALATVLDGDKASYFAMPISSGRRLWDLAAELKVANLDLVAQLHPREFKSRVLGPNLKDATMLFRQVKPSVSGTLVNPVEFFSEGWVQEDYRELWRRVLERWIDRVILAPHWEYSRGCVEECVTALLRKVRIFLLSEGAGRGGFCLRRLSAGEARDRVAEAAYEGARIGVEVRFLTRAHKRISRLS